ncbi:O-methyltransferase [Actinomadura oligospora]|uniref:O-methyltransferase n=1 Tax=Actinomadura oligospora TaxID=111804 RepID=UPI0004AE1ED8|nr:O-methyltransferase [Actinomadura oligospora]
MEEFLPEDEATADARRRGHEVGAVPIGAAGGAALRFLATLIGARNVVEIGTGCGVSGISLMRGMPKDGVLTSVDVDHENQRLAKLAYREAGLGSFRTRMIVGRALEVLPRLTDGGYDMVFCDAVKTEYPEYFSAALRLLRPGGVVAFDNALWHQRVADPAYRGDAATEAIREVHHMIREDERLVPLLIPVGDGLLCAVKRD